MGGVCEQLIFSKVRDEEVQEVRDLINQSYREQESQQTFSENIIFLFSVENLNPEVAFKTDQRFPTMDDFNQVRDKLRVARYDFVWKIKFNSGNI